MEWSVNPHAELFSVSRSWFWFCFVSIKDGPLLLLSSSLADSGNLSVFRISAAESNYIISFIDDSSIGVFEKLVPLSISVVCIGISSSYIKRSIRIFNGLNCLGDLIECPELFFIPCSVFQDTILSWQYCDNSMEKHVGDNVEWSINIERSILVHSFSQSLIHLIQIKYLPSLVLLVGILCSELEVSTFDILAALNTHDSLIEVVTSNSEQRMPTNKTKDGRYFIWMRWISD
jgi:hypothetical protein